MRACGRGRRRPGRGGRTGGEAGGGGCRGGRRPCRAGRPRRRADGGAGQGAGVRLGGRRRPSGILSGSPRGANDLYVALTRTTSRLGILHVGDLLAVLARVRRPGTGRPDGSGCPGRGGAGRLTRGGASTSHGKTHRPAGARSVPAYPPGVGAAPATACLFHPPPTQGDEPGSSLVVVKGCGQGLWTSCGQDCAPVDNSRRGGCRTAVTAGGRGGEAAVSVDNPSRPSLWTTSRVGRPRSGRHGRRTRW
jgi:hypothetical protein